MTALCKSQYVFHLGRVYSLWVLGNVTNCVLLTSRERKKDCLQAVFPVQVIFAM